VVDPQRRKLILAYRLEDMSVWKLESQSASVKEAFNVNHSVDSKKKKPKQLRVFCAVILTTICKEQN